MKTFKPSALALLLSLFVVQTFTARAQGNLTPPGAPAPTMKTLDQIEARTPISTAPFTISTPGSYYLTTNLSVSSGNAVIITASNVTLDLNGFTINSTQNPATTGKAIALGSGSGPVANVTIRNGFISSGVTNNGASFSGSGFAYGIYQFGGLPSVNVQVSSVAVSGCLFMGINLGASNTVVESCTVNMAGTTGIYAQSISSSTAMNCGSYGIYATDNANNCSGSGVINGVGVYADIANNCRGTGAGSGSGVAATVANNCHGSSVTGTGVSATTALNCYGSSGGQSGYGIFGTSAQNCYGSSSSSGIGIYETGTATGCVGFSSSGTGLYAFIANACSGQTTSGTALSFTHNVNSF